MLDHPLTELIPAFALLKSHSQRKGILMERNSIDADARSSSTWPRRSRRPIGFFRRRDLAIPSGLTRPDAPREALRKASMTQRTLVRETGDGSRSDVVKLNLT